MLRNMTNSLLKHEAIKTTLPKAKELRRVVEPMITLGKKPSLANRRLAFNRLRDRDMVVKLFGELGPRYAKRNGGYLRILKYGFRDGDNAPMAFVELVEKVLLWRAGRLPNVDLYQSTFTPDYPDTYGMDFMRMIGAIWKMSC